MKCAFCGQHFEEEQATSCRGCGSLRRCYTLRCPRCGYPTYRDAKIVEVIRRWWNKAKKKRRASGA